MQMKVTPLRDKETLVVSVCYILMTVGVGGPAKGAFHPYLKAIGAKLLLVSL